MDEMQAATYRDPMQKDLTAMVVETRMCIGSIDTFTKGDISIHFPSNVIYTATFTAVNGDKIFKTDYGYAQVKKYTKVFIYLL